MMKRFLSSVLVLGAFTLVVTGCNKSSGGSGGSSSNGCPSGAYTDPAGEYCFSLPADYKAQPEKANADERYTTFIKGDPGATSNHGNIFTVSVQPLEMYDALESRVTHPLGNATVVEQTDIKGGKYAQLGRPNTKEQSYFAVVKGAKHAISCSGQHQDAKPHPEFATACKSLMALPAAK